MMAWSKILLRFCGGTLGRKLVCVTGLSTAAGAIVAGGALYWHQSASLRHQFSDEIEMLVGLVAAYVAAPVAFSDAEGARDVLAQLGINPNIVEAELRLVDGSEFARFGSSEIDEENPKTGASAGFHGSWLHVTRPVLLDGEAIATLHVVASFAPVRDASLRAFLPPLAGVLVAALAMTMATTASLRGRIVGPVRRLAHLAQRVADERDYSLRAPAAGRDEVGQLTDAVNTMLGRIEAADRELRAAYTRLESETRERDRLNADLVKASRLAGMTEVANGVLHNVGNVLNTVNLTVHGMRDRLLQARFRHLRQAVALLESEQHRLADFLTADPRGRAMPGFLAQLATHFEAENEALLGEATRLVDKVDHLKEIISTQQSHSRVFGVAERADAADIVEDALRIVHDSLARHRIDLHRDFRDAAPVRVDRHKTVQILVNLLNNGRDAIDAGGDGSRRLEVSIAPAGATHVAIGVSDAGAGILPENLPRLFRHGFTTKADGHGFGLHMSALAAQEMHGTLRVRSDGPGRGACFTLELPIHTSVPST